MSASPARSRSAPAISSPYVSKGKRPTFFSIHAIWSEVFFSHGSRTAASSAGTTSRRGSPCGPRRCRTVRGRWRPGRARSPSGAACVVPGSGPAGPLDPPGHTVRHGRVGGRRGHVEGEHRLVGGVIVAREDQMGGRLPGWPSRVRPRSVPSLRPRPSWNAGRCVCRTVIRSVPPLGSGTAGVITRSSPALVKDAGRPLTSTDWTVPCAKSRLTLSSRWVARALILVTAVRACCCCRDK